MAVLAKDARWVDPPSGWMYGFPRLYNPEKDGTLSEFYTHHGYPDYDLEFALNHTRSWTDE